MYVRSTFLEGAGWDQKNSVLVEPDPMQLVCNMPVIHFRPTEQLKKRTKGNDREGDDVGDVDGKIVHRGLTFSLFCLFSTQDCTTVPAIIILRDAGTKDDQRSSWQSI